MASKGELAAARMTIDQIRDHVGATTLGYLSIEGATSAVGRGSSNFCLACFSGNYPIAVPEDLSKMAFEQPPDVGQMETVSTGQLRLIEA